MERCNYVQFCDPTHHHDLKKISEGIFQLNVIEGEIISCEPDSRGLVIKLDDYATPSLTKDKEIIWNYGGRLALPAICGQALRCFYEESHIIKGDVIGIEMDAWELMSPGSSGFVVRRATKSSDYKFIDSE